MTTRIRAKEFNVDGDHANRLDNADHYERNLEYIKNMKEYSNGKAWITIKDKVKEPYIKFFTEFEYYHEYSAFRNDFGYLMNILMTKRSDKEEQKENIHEGIRLAYDRRIRIRVNNNCYETKAMQYMGKTYYFDLNTRKCSHKKVQIDGETEWVKRDAYNGEEVEGWEFTYYYDKDSNYLSEFYRALDETIFLSNDFEVEINGKPYELNHEMPIGNYKDKKWDYTEEFDYHLEIVDDLEKVNEQFEIPCYWRTSDEETLVKHAKTKLIGVKGWVILHSTDQLANDKRDTPTGDITDRLNDLVNNIKSSQLEEIANKRRMKRLEAEIIPSAKFYKLFFKEVLSIDLKIELDSLVLEGKIDKMNEITEVIANINRISDISKNLNELTSKFYSSNGYWSLNHFIDSKHRNTYMNVGGYGYRSNLTFLRKIFAKYNVMDRLNEICQDAQLGLLVTGDKSPINLKEFNKIQDKSIFVSYYNQKQNFTLGMCFNSIFTKKYGVFSLTEYDQLFLGNSFVKASLGENVLDKDSIEAKELEEAKRKEREEEGEIEEEIKEEEEKDLEEKEISEENDEDKSLEERIKELEKDGEKVDKAIEESQKATDEALKRLEESEKEFEEEGKVEKSDEKEIELSDREIPEDLMKVIESLKQKITDLEGKSEEEEGEIEYSDENEDRHLTSEEIEEEGNLEEEKPTIEQTYEVDTKGNIVQKQSQITQVPKTNGEIGDREGESQSNDSDYGPPSKGVKGTDANDFNDISIDGNGESLTNAQYKEGEKPTIEQIKEKVDDFWKNYQEPTDFYEAGIVMDSKAFGGSGAKINYLFNSKEDKELYEQTKSLKSIGIPQKSRLNYKTFAMWKEAVRGCLEVLPRNTKTVPFFYYDIEANSRAFISSDMSYVAINIALIDQWEASYGKLKANNLVQYIQQRAIHESAHYFAKKHNDNFIAGEGLVNTAVYVTDLFDRMRKIFNAKNLAKTLEDLKPHVNENRSKEIPYKVEKIGETKHYCVCPECKHTILMTESQSDTYTRSAEMLRENPIGIIVIGVKCECGEEF